MAKFAKPATQAASVMKRMQGGAIRSVGTVRNYELRLKLVTQWVQQNRLGSLRELTPERALDYHASAPLRLAKRPWTWTGKPYR